MNPITLFLLAAVAIGFLGPVLVILSYVDKIRSSNVRDNERARLAQIKIQDAARRAQLHEAKLARENNAVTLQDAKLELELLKIQKLKKDMGLNAPDFNPTDYSS